MSAAVATVLMLDLLRGLEVTERVALRASLGRFMSRLESAAGAAAPREESEWFDPNFVLRGVPERRRRCRGLCS